MDERGASGGGRVGRSVGPPRLFGEITTLLRGRLNGVILFAIALMGVAFATLRFSLGHAGLALLEAAFSVLFFAVAIFEHRRPGSRAAPWTIVFGVFAMIAIISFTTGELYSSAHRWLCALPLVGVVLGSARLAWAVALAVVAHCVLAAQGWLGELPVETAHLASPALHMWSAIGLDTIILVIALAYDRFRAESVRMLADANDALGRANEEAQAANVAKSEFLASLSHELRTPLAGMVGRASLLVDAQTSAEDRAELDAIRRAGGSLLQVFDSMLGFARAESTTPEPSPTVVVTTDLVSDLLSAFGYTARAAELSLDARIAEDAPARFVIDGGWLRQVLVNLLGNALKFTDVGGVTLVVEPAGARLRFVVEDTGIGLPDGAPARLFLPFTQADASASRRHGGVGLGLAISRELATRLGGELHAERRATGGSAFSLVVPYGNAPAPAEDKEPRDVPFRRCRVLLVEDTEVIRAVSTALLKRMGHDVEAVSSGESGLARFTAETFDVVLLDCHLPGVDGYQVARRMRALEDGRHTRIVAMTAETGDAVRERCLAAGMDDLVTKPVDADALRRALFVSPTTTEARSDAETNRLAPARSSVVTKT